MKKHLSIKLRRIVFITSLCPMLSGYSARLLAIEKTLIFPIPQQMEVTDELVVLDESVSIVIPEQSSEKDLFLARFLVRELSDKYGIAVKIEPGKVIPKDRRVVVMGAFTNPLIKKYCIDNKLDVTVEDPAPEGYLLRVSSDKT